MRILVALICSLALVSVAHGEQKQEKKSQQKKQAQTAPRSAQPARQATGAGKKPPVMVHQGQNARQGQTSTATHQAQKGKNNQISKPGYGGKNRNRSETSTTAQENQKAKTGQNQIQRQAGTAAKAAQVKPRGKPREATTAANASNSPAKGKAAQGKPLRPQHFNVPKQPNTAKAPPVKFQQGRRIQGSQNWQGARYTVFRNYTPQWHNQGWWHNHYNRIVFVFGAPYYWNAGYWFPAWGYYPNAYYAWDGPIYAYNNLPPDQVIANVQATLQQQGYYHGDVDGLVGPLTRGAIADYQRDHGLYVTSTIDQPTLQSLNMA
jgi:Putative peptidoglycan binding domain